ncbi:MAG: hypothetical protein IJO64_02795 [Clostridia bacterium]|nr:hypothetical protein [Clostridia bacterium]
MKKCLVFVIAIIFCLPMLSVNAACDSFDTAKVDENTAKTVLSQKNVRFIKEYNSDYDTGIVKSFNVNENGNVAIILESGECKYIAVYDDNGGFLRGYLLTSPGDMFVQWSGENIDFVFVKTGYIISVDDKGNVIDVSRVSDIDGNKEDFEKLSKQKSECVNGSKYELKKKYTIRTMFSGGTERIIKTLPDGEEKLIWFGQKQEEYERPTEYSAIKSRAISIALAIFFAGALIVWCIKRFVKRRKEKVQKKTKLLH